MSKIAVSCGECGAKFPASVQAAGKKVPCPTCGELVKVPRDAGEGEESEFEETPRRSRSSKSSKSSTAKKSSNSSGPPWVLIVGGVAALLILAGGLGLVYFLNQSVQPVMMPVAVGTGGGSRTSSNSARPSKPFVLPKGFELPDQPQEVTGLVDCFVGNDSVYVYAQGLRDAYYQDPSKTPFPLLIAVNRQVSLERVERMRYRVKSAVPPAVYTVDAITALVENDPVQAKLDLNMESIVLTGKFKSRKDFTVTFESKEGFSVTADLNTPDGEKFQAQPGTDIKFVGRCRVDTFNGLGVFLWEAHWITVPFPVPGVQYPTSIEPRAARQQRLAAVTRSAKPEFQTDALSLTAAYKAKGLNKTQFSGKVCEITAKVSKMGIDFQHMNDEITLDDGQGEFRGIRCRMVEPAPWRTVLPGQTVVVRGWVQDWVWNVDVHDAVIVKVEPNSVKPTEGTAAALVEECQKDNMAFETKYKGQWMIVSGPLLLNSDGKPTIQAGQTNIPISFADSSGTQGAQMKKRKVGEEVRILGKVSYTFSKYFALGDAWDVTPPSTP